jgi:hypothetical protein
MNPVGQDHPRHADENWRTALAERTSRQQAALRRHGRWLLGAIALVVTAALALLLGPSDNRAALFDLWRHPPTLEPAAAPVNPDQAARELLGAPADPSAPARDRPLIDQDNLRMAAELIDFISPHGTGRRSDDEGGRK